MERAGLGPKALGDRVDASRQSVDKWLKGHELSATYLGRVSDATGVSMDWLQNGADSVRELGGRPAIQFPVWRDFMETVAYERLHPQERDVIGSTRFPAGQWPTLRLLQNWAWDLADERGGPGSSGIRAHTKKNDTGGA